MSQIYGIKCRKLFSYLWKINTVSVMVKSKQNLSNLVYLTKSIAIFFYILSHILDPSWKLQIEFHDCKSLGK